MAARCCLTEGAARRCCSASIDGDVDGLHIAQMLDAASLAPGGEIPSRRRVCGLRMFAVENSMTRRAVEGSGENSAGSVKAEWSCSAPRFPAGWSRASLPA
jgi:hypothetical protein